MAGAQGDTTEVEQAPRVPRVRGQAHAEAEDDPHQRCTAADEQPQWVDLRGSTRDMASGHVRACSFATTAGTTDAAVRFDVAAKTASTISGGMIGDQ